jgi:hypothetical protein
MMISRETEKKFREKPARSVSNLPKSPGYNPRFCGEKSEPNRLNCGET